MCTGKTRHTCTKASLIYEVGRYLVDRGPPVYRENPRVKLFCLETPLENPGDDQLIVYGGWGCHLSLYVCVCVCVCVCVGGGGGGCMCGRERESVWRGRRGEGNVNVVLASKGV